MEKEPNVVALVVAAGVDLLVAMYMAKDRSWRWLTTKATTQCTQ